MIRIDVGFDGGSYPVLIGEGLAAQAGQQLGCHVRESRCIVVSDDAVWPAQGERLTHGLAATGIAAEPLIVPHGEASKSWAMLADLCERLLATGIERGDTILAFGGGMVGDLAGLAASLVKRGCGIVHMPTSLLAQVDAAIGGKTAINTPAGKNMVGAFHRPTAVLIDPALLATLPPRHLRAGYAEIVKYGLIGDPAFFAWCEANGDAVLQGDPAARLHAIETSVRAKAAIVAADERETGGLRALLNFGHDFAHAMEAEAGFCDRLLHGEAVAAGMALAFRFSAERGLCGPGDAARVAACLRAAGLPASLAEAGIDASGERLAAHIANDKKKSGGIVPLVLARGIGDAFLDSTAPLAEAAAFLDRDAGRKGR